MCRRSRVQAEVVGDNIPGEFWEGESLVIGLISNPLFSLGHGPARVSSTPFALLEHAGLHGRKIENSLFGTIPKLITETVATLTAIFGSRKLIGREDLLIRLFE